jgi:D-psicose/D-tagatose/L-ribulose 3-epimerase
MLSVDVNNDRIAQAVIKRLGFHALVLTGSWGVPDCERVVASASRLGFRFVEVPSALFALEGSLSPEAAKAIFDGSDVEMMLSTRLPDDCEIVSDDLHSMERGASHLLDVVELARCVGVGTIGGALTSTLRSPVHAVSTGQRANAVAILRNVASAASDVGAVLHIEVLNRFESNLFNTAEEGLRFVDDVGAPNLLLQLDTFHMNIEENSIAGAVCAVWRSGRLGKLQISESHRGYLGRGTLRLNELLKELQSQGVEADVSIEAFSGGTSATRAGLCKHAWRQLWTDGEDLLEQGLQELQYG